MCLEASARTLVVGFGKQTKKHRRNLVQSEIERAVGRTSQAGPELVCHYAAAEGCANTTGPFRSPNLPAKAPHHSQGSY
jgi:hypothetical protein